MVPVQLKITTLESKKLMMTTFRRADVRDDNWILTKIAFLRRFCQRSFSALNDFSPILWSSTLHDPDWTR